MLITEPYRALNAKLHADRDDYGRSGARWAGQIRQLASATDSTTILDYGCGKRTLEQALGFAIANYDPAIPELSDPPAPADLVVCTDVLEHLEPELLDEVLDDLARVTERCLFATVHTAAAKKFLADGRNAHLIQEGPEWWLPKLMSRFTLVQFNNMGIEFLVVMKPALARDVQ